MPQSPTPISPATTSDDFIDAVREFTSDIMSNINLVPKDFDLRSNVSLICGMALGLAYRVQKLEREKSEARRNTVKRFPEGWCEACGNQVDPSGECGCPPF